MDTPIDKTDETVADSSTVEKTPLEDFSETTDESSEGEEKSRSAEDRINQLIAVNKDLERKLETALERMAPPPAPTIDPKPLSPDVEKAREYLRNELKVVTQEDLDKKLQAIQDRAILDTEHSRLANAYGGSDGRPKYERSEVEDYMRKHGVYDPEVAYKALHETELLDWALKKVESERKQRPYVEKQSTSNVNRDDQTITREKIEDSMKTPEGRIWYEKNRDKILKLLQQGAL